MSVMMHGCERTHLRTARLLVVQINLGGISHRHLHHRVAVVVGEAEEGVRICNNSSAQAGSHAKLHRDNLA